MFDLSSDIVAELSNMAEIEADELPIQPSPFDPIAFQGQNHDLMFSAYQLTEDELLE